MFQKKDDEWDNSLKCYRMPHYYYQTWYLWRGFHSRAGSIVASFSNLLVLWLQGKLSILCDRRGWNGTNGWRIQRFRILRRIGSDVQHAPICYRQGRNRGISVGDEPTDVPKDRAFQSLQKEKSLWNFTFKSRHVKVIRGKITSTHDALSLEWHECSLCSSTSSSAAATSDMKQPDSPQFFSNMTSLECDSIPFLASKLHHHPPAFNAISNVLLTAAAAYLE